jgi:hypothetical protein
MTLTMNLLGTEATHHSVHPLNDVFFLQSGMGQVNVMLDIGEHLIKTI